VTTLHVGPYDGLKGTWATLAKWLASSEHEGRDAPWEEYLDDPRSTPPDKLRTRIVWPIA
jgi:effector-binding domain-containing protein